MDKITKNKKKIVKRISKLYTWLYNISIRTDMGVADKFAFIDYQNIYKYISERMFSIWSMEDAYKNMSNDDLVKIRSEINLLVMEIQQEIERRGNDGKITGQNAKMVKYTDWKKTERELAMLKTLYSLDLPSERIDL